VTSDQVQDVMKSHLMKCDEVQDVTSDQVQHLMSDQVQDLVCSPRGTFCDSFSLFPLSPMYTIDMEERGKREKESH